MQERRNEAAQAIADAKADKRNGLGYCDASVTFDDLFHALRIEFGGRTTDRCYEVFLADGTSISVYRQRDRFGWISDSLTGTVWIARYPDGSRTYEPHVLMPVAA